MAPACRQRHTSSRAQGMPACSSASACAGCDGNAGLLGTRRVRGRSRPRGGRDAGSGGASSHRSRTPRAARQPRPGPRRHLRPAGLRCERSHRGPRVHPARPLRPGRQTVADEQRTGWGWMQRMVRPVVREVAVTDPPPTATPARTFELRLAGDAVIDLESQIREYGGSRWWTRHGLPMAATWSEFSRWWEIEDASQRCYLFEDGRRGVNPWRRTSDPRERR